MPQSNSLILERRHKTVAVSLDLIHKMMIQGTTNKDHTLWGWRCIEGLPCDAILVDSWTEMWGHPTLHLLFSHPSWPDLHAADEVPALTPLFRQETAS